MIVFPGPRHRCLVDSILYDHSLGCLLANLNVTKVTTLHNAGVAMIPSCQYQGRSLPTANKVITGELVEIMAVKDDTAHVEVCSKDEHQHREGRASTHALVYNLYGSNCLQLICSRDGKNDSGGCLLHKVDSAKSLNAG